MMKTILSAAAAAALLGMATAASAQTAGDDVPPISPPDTVSPADAPDTGNIYYRNLPDWAQRAFIPPDSRGDGSAGDGGAGDGDGDG